MLKLVFEEEEDVLGQQLVFQGPVSKTGKNRRPD